VGVNGRYAQALELDQPAEVRAVGVCQQDMFQVRHHLVRASYLMQHDPYIGVEEGVDDRQVFAVVEQEGAHASALLVPYAVDAFDYLHAW
jgi:hypothetical protein